MARKHNHSECTGIRGILTRQPAFGGGGGCLDCNIPLINVIYDRCAACEQKHASRQTASAQSMLALKAYSWPMPKTPAEIVASGSLY